MFRGHESTPLAKAWCWDDHVTLHWYRRLRLGPCDLQRSVFVSLFPFCSNTSFLFQPIDESLMTHRNKQSDGRRFSHWMFSLGEKNWMTTIKPMSVKSHCFSLIPSKPIKLNYWKIVEYKYWEKIRVAQYVMVYCIDIILKKDKIKQECSSVYNL